MSLKFLSIILKEQVHNFGEIKLIILERNFCIYRRESVARMVNTSHFQPKGCEFESPKEVGAPREGVKRERNFCIYTNTSMQQHWCHRCDSYLKCPSLDDMSGNVHQQKGKRRAARRVGGEQQRHKYSKFSTGNWNFMSSILQHFTQKTRKHSHFSNFFFWQRIHLLWGENDQIFNLELAQNMKQ